tara:strand:+ start:682 stop:2370 length:1689 start_codon:yes stop_codon:yes gene_type:complete
MKLERKINDLIILLNSKQYGKLIFEIESNFSDKEINSQVLLILGLARMKSNDRNSKDVLLALQNFRKGYILDKKSKIGLDCLTYYLYGICEKVEQDNTLPPDEYEEIKKFFYEAKSILNYDEKLYHAMSLISFRSSNVHFRLNILKELIDKDCSREKNLILFEYIYNNNLRYNWSQKDFFDFTNKIKDKLPFINLPKIEEIKQEKIKIGFVSSNLSSNHSVTYFVKDLFNFRNENFEIHIFSDFDAKREDNTTKIIKTNVDFFHNISKKSNSEFASFLRSIGIDILIDMNGYVGKGRVEIFNSRVCKLQISWLGYNNTIGLNHSDYLIADKNLILENEKGLYKEKIIYLDGIWNSHSGLNIARKFNKLPSQNNDTFTLGSFNNYSKISEDTVEVWSKILKKIKNSKLILKSSVTHSEIHFKDIFKKEGILNKVIFKDRSNNFEEHMNLYKDIDLCLDTFPYTGVTTTCEALWMNVPVISMEGFNFNSRCGKSILINSDLKDMVAKNKDEYISKVVSLANDPNKLEKIRKHIFDEVLKTNTFNTKRFAANFWKSILDTYKNHK